MLALIFALKQEQNAILKESVIQSSVRSNQTEIKKVLFHGKPLLLCKTGIGMGNAHEGTKQLLGLFQPSLLFSVGYAGGVQQGLQSGDLILPTEIRSEAGDRFPLDQVGVKEISQIIEKEKITSHRGPLLTVFDPLTTKEQKKRAGESGAIAVDMETAAIASICHKVNVPFASLRIVFDPVEMELPIDAKGKLTWKVILKIPQMAKAHWKCQKNLASVLKEFIALKGR
ncbi:MAG: hypothetical protein HYT77_05865 [Deltaproteobacteria bacterium]|nr:hypothetical protein [Deltaproteobacteria bacterium]